MNGKELFMYKHRIPLDKVAALSIAGDVSVGMFGFMMVSITGMCKTCTSTVPLTQVTVYAVC